jgi:hypothetical protein
MFSSSVREAGALWIFLNEILPASTRQTSILWRVDNTSALAHIRKEGGLRGRRLLLESERILLHLHSRRLRVLPAFALPAGAGLALGPQRVPVGNTPDRPLRVAPVGAGGAFNVLAGSGSSGGRRCPQHEVGLSPGLPLPSRSPPQEGREEVGGVEGVYLLVTPYWEAQTWFASLQSLPLLEVRRLPFHDALVVDLTTGEPPPSLERLFLVVWRICGGLGESTPCQTGLSGLSRQDGSDPQRTGMKGPGNPSKPSCALPPFFSIRHL